MGRFRSVISAAWFFGALGAALWALALADARGKSTPAILCVDTGAAVFSSVAALVCTLARRQGNGIDRRFAAMRAEYERREAALIRLAARHGTPTGPMPLYRVR